MTVPSGGPAARCEWGITEAARDLPRCVVRRPARTSRMSTCPFRAYQLAVTAAVPIAGSRTGHPLLAATVEKIVPPSGGPVGKQGGELSDELGRRRGGASRPQPPRADTAATIATATASSTGAARGARGLRVLAFSRFVARSERLRLSCSSGCPVPVSTGLAGWRFCAVQAPWYEP